MTEDEVHIHIHVDRVMNDEAMTILRRLDQQGTQMAIDITEALSETERGTSVTQSVLALVDAMAAQLRQLAADLAAEPAVQAAINNMADQWSANNDAIVAAVEANTPTTPA